MCYQNTTISLLQSVYLSISANVFAGHRFVCSPAPNSMSRLSPTKEALEDWAESNIVTESWALKIRDESTLPCGVFATSMSCFCLMYWVAFPRNMMLFNTLTDVRLCRGQDGKLNQVWPDFKTPSRNFEVFWNLVARFSNCVLFVCVYVCLRPDLTM